jgi:ribosome-interacting GTPase 1
MILSLLLPLTRCHCALLNMCSALVWGSSVKHNPQKVGREHVLHDEDVVSIVKKIK